VKAELRADVSAVKPGEEFTLGVLLKIKPKWHIYWKYPGDAGLATAVTMEAARQQRGCPRSRSCGFRFRSGSINREMWSDMDIRMKCC
jgi:hypothetical protein